MMAWLWQKRQLIVATIAAASALWLVQLPAQPQETTGMTVFAASSLKNALDAISADYLRNTGNKVTIAYAASSALAKQIEQGAPADVFFSADLEWMNYLAQKSLVLPGSQQKVLGNRLVLIAPAASASTLKIGKDFALADALGGGRLAMADVAAVPAGKYGKAALEKLGVWTAVEPKIAQAENVRAALALVARAEAVLGIVYLSDTTAESKVKVVDTFPEESHPPIVYPIAITTAARHPDEAAAFVKYLTNKEAQARFIKEGFDILK